MRSSFLKRPIHSQEKNPPSANIFEKCQEVHLPVIKQLAKNEDQDYHVVGPEHLRKKILEEQNPSHTKSRTDSLENMEQRRSLPELTKTVQTSLLRESVLSKLSKHERKALMRDKRNLEFYKDYQQFWENSSKRFRQSIGGTHPTLLQASVQRLQVIPNPEKDELLKNYVNTYWEMSLRNNNYILKRHIKGESRYDEAQMEGMLQSGEGTKIVKKSIPKLPLEKLRKTDHRQFALSGRNKLASESLSCDPSIASQYTSRLSKAMTDGAALDRKQQILKMSYDSSHSFLKEEPIH